MRKSVAVIITAAVMSFVFSSCSVAKIFNNGQPLDASLSEEEVLFLSLMCLRNLPGS